jgi:polysaccharide biosynthesis protein VpsQ
MVRVTLLYASLLLCAVLLADTGLVPEFLQHFRHLSFVDKVTHFSLFGLLAFFANATLILKSRWSPTRAIVTGSILVMVIASIDELSNLVITHRTWSLGDVAANYLGILCLGVVPMVAWQWTHQRRLYKAALEARQSLKQQRAFRFGNQAAAHVEFSPPQQAAPQPVAVHS